MPPIRKQDSTQLAESSSTSRFVSKPNTHKRRKNIGGPTNFAPGIQKIKAALRQTRRLLAKDKLAADVRVENERRLKALEADLHEAEIAKKERTLAVRYHKVKFFERQKVTRKIRQTQKRLDLADGRSEKKKITKDLQGLRVDLNYITHYPKMKKYISLFPPEVRKGEDVSPVSPVSQAEKTSVEREQIRNWIMQQMERGELPSEPELEVGFKEKERTRTRMWPSDERQTISAKSGTSKGNQDEEEDEFFGEDDEGEDSS